jgi:hypothetical protein
VVVDLLVGLRSAPPAPLPPPQPPSTTRRTNVGEHRSARDSSARTRTRLNALAALDLVRAQLSFARSADAERRAWLAAERARLLEIVVRFAPGGPGDGRRLSDEASDALLRNIFGDEQPA